MVKQTFLYMLFTIDSRPATSKIENKELRSYIDKYLNLGEWVLDTTTVLMNNSSYFERKH